ncbi:MAG TPA: hemerythrin [Janthinobacterium sp.]|nr:hemerythrin [Janthinobacterium sp.]
MNKENAAPDALTLLSADHQTVRRLFQECEELRDKQGQDDLKAELVEQICFELSVHALVEAEIFYPAVRAAIEDDELMDEAEAEHAGAKDLIAQLEAMLPGDEQFNATVTVLSEQVEHHIQTEEGDMFVKARNAGLDMARLGQRIQERKEEFESGFDAAPAPVGAKAGTQPKRDAP